MKNPNKKITGSVQKKNGKLYLAINLYDGEGKRKPKWINTDLEIRGNKKKAQELLEEELEKYNSSRYNNVEFICKKETELFCDYIKSWLKIQKLKVEEVSYSSDAITVNVHLFPYFEEKQYLVSDINSDIINQYFYDKKNGYGGRKKLSGTSLQRHHATISSIIKRAIKEGYIDKENVEDIVKPKNDTKKAKWYSQDQMQELLDLLKQKNSKLLLPVLLISAYGFRREEVVGIREEDIDFENHVLYIQHTVATCYLYDDDNDTYKTTHIKKDDLKTESSKRAFPLFEEMEIYLKNAIKTKEMYREIYGNTYNSENEQYLLVHENGNLLTPDYITHTLGKIIKKNNLAKVNVHGLRHSSASLLLAFGYSMKEIQEWLGHSSYTTTAKIYAHVSSKSKENITNTLAKRLSF